KHHGGEAIGTEVGMGDGVVGEMGDAGEGADRHGGTLKGSERVTHGSEDDEPECGRTDRFPEMTDHGEVMVDGDGDDGDEHHDACRYGCGDEPCGERSADEVVHAVPRVEESQR